MAFIRVKRHGNREYYYLVEGKREGKKVRQKVIKYLGITPPTKEQIEIMRRERWKQQYTAGYQPKTRRGSANQGFYLPQVWLWVETEGRPRCHWTKPLILSNHTTYQKEDKMKHQQGVTALPKSPTLSQLWEALDSKLIETAEGQLPSKQRVERSNRSRDATETGILLNFFILRPCLTIWTF